MGSTFPPFLDNVKKNCKIGKVEHHLSSPGITSSIGMINIIIYSPIRFIMIFRDNSHGNNAKTFSESSKHWITFFQNKSIFQLVAQPLSAINCFSYVQQCTVVHNCCAFTLHISLLRGIVFFSILIFCLSHSHKKSKFEAAHKRSTLRHCDKVHGCQCMHRTAINYLPLRPHW